MRKPALTRCNEMATTSAGGSGGIPFQQANCWCVPGSPLQDEFPQDTNDALLRLMGWGWTSARVPTHYVSPPFEGDPPTPPPWYFRQQADRMISVAVIFWHKHLRHFGLINIFTWFFWKPTPHPVSTTSAPSFMASTTLLLSTLNPFTEVTPTFIS